DYVFALQRAAKEGYDFNWYWQLAGGIKGWSDVTDKHADPSTLAITAVGDKIGAAYALNVNTLVASGPFMVQTWNKSDNTMTLVKNPKYNAPWPPQIDKLTLDTQLG